MEYIKISKALIIVAFILGLSGCDPYNGFGCVAPEAHPTVEQARSLSSEQFETVFIEVQKLSKLHSHENYHTQFLKPDIPESLSFLNAEVIRVYRESGAYIILANCFDERIELTLSQEGEAESTITLHWAEPTNESPYATGSQVIWRKTWEGSVFDVSDE